MHWRQLSLFKIEPETFEDLGNAYQKQMRSRRNACEVSTGGKGRPAASEEYKIANLRPSKPQQYTVNTPNHKAEDEQATSLDSFLDISQSVRIGGKGDDYRSPKIERITSHVQIQLDQCQSFSFGHNLTYKIFDYNKISKKMVPHDYP